MSGKQAIKAALLQRSVNLKKKGLPIIQQYEIEIGKVNINHVKFFEHLCSVGRNLGSSC